jgi:type IV secretion system protein VirB9
MAAGLIMVLRRASLNLVTAACLTAAAPTLSGCKTLQFADMDYWLSGGRTSAEAEGQAPPALVSEPVVYEPVPAQHQPDAAPTPEIVEVPVYVPAPRTFFDVEEERRKGAKRAAQAARGSTVHDPRKAVRTASEGRFMNASLVQPFTDNMIYEVKVQVGRLTTIRLEPGEDITSLEASDSSTLQFATSQVGRGSTLSHVIVLKPSAEFETNNLQIVTTRRLYLIDLVMADPGSEAYHRMVQWSYPTIRLPIEPLQPMMTASAVAQYGAAQAQAPAGYQPEMPQLASAAPGSTPRPARLWDLNFGYVVSGPDVPWKPITVYDDGAKTVIRFSPEILARKAPALFVIDLEGAVEAVNYRVRGSSYVVDGLFDRAALQLGQDREAVVTIARSGIWNDPSTARPAQAPDTAGGSR